MTQEQTIDLEAGFWADIKEAADQSTWIPHEHYFMNDWVSDVCRFLRTGGATRPAPDMAAVVEALMEDRARLDYLRDESQDLLCFDMPTGGGDADIGWRVVGHWMAKPQQRVVAEIYHDDPRAAIDAARAAMNADPQGTTFRAALQSLRDAS